MLLGDTEGTQIILISLDLCFHDDSLTSLLRNYIAKKYHMPRENLVVSFTHTHFAPSVQGYDLVFHEPKHEKFLLERMKQCIDRAFLNIYSGTVEYGMVDGQWNISRRLNIDGATRFMPNLEGETDKSIYMLKIADEQGNIKALLVNYACHPSNPNEYRTISSEYPGRLCQILEQKYYGCTALFFQGSGADSKLRIGAEGKKFVPVGYEACNEIAGEMAEHISTLLLSKHMTPVEVSLASQVFQIPIPLEVYPKYYYQKESALHSGQPGVHFDQSHVNDNCRDLLRRASADYVIDHYDEMPDTICLNCGIIKISKGLYIFTMGGEPCYNVKQVLSQLVPDRRMMFFGYTDAIAYIPSDKIISEGGYKAEGSVTEYRLKGRIAPGIDALFIEYFKNALLKLDEP